LTNFLESFGGTRFALARTEALNHSGLAAAKVAHRHNFARSQSKAASLRPRLAKTVWAR
jgi:hypothetical protein